MVNFDKVNFELRPIAYSPSLQVIGTITIGASTIVSKQAIASYRGDIIQEEIKPLIKANMHHHIYGELRPILAELHNVIAQYIPPHHFSEHAKAKELFDKLEELLKRP